LLDSDFEVLDTWQDHESLVLVVDDVARSVKEVDVSDLVELDVSNIE
jgi:hypothetical protein